MRPSPPHAGILAGRDCVEGYRRPSRLSTAIRDVQKNHEWTFRHAMEERIVEILNSVADHARPGHYSLTVYQIAIEFAQRFEPDFLKMDRPIGGTGAGNRALTKYMAKQLSTRIKAGQTPQIEMMFLHPADTQSLVYQYKDQQIVATLPAAGYPIPLDRLRPNT